MSSAALPVGPPENDFSVLAFPVLAARAGEVSQSRDDDRARIERSWQARGHAAGYAEGLRAAAVAAADRVAQNDAEHAALMQDVRQQKDAALAVLQAAARSLDARTIPVLRDAEDTLLDVAMQLAEAVVGHALADEAAAARFALGRSGDHTGATGSRPATHTVRLHPHDLALVDPATAGQTGVTFLADAGLARGDAISEFPDGYLDARIGSAFERVKTALAAGAA